MLPNKKQLKLFVIMSLCLQSSSALAKTPLPAWTTLTPRSDTIRFIVPPQTSKDAPSCDSVLAACGRAVEAQKKALEAQQAVIEQLKKTSVDDREALAKSQDKGFFGNPAVLILLGALGGVILTEKVLK